MPGRSSTKRLDFPNSRADSGTNLRTAPFQQTVAQIAVGGIFGCMWSTPTEMQSTSENDFECLASTGVKSPANAMLERLAPTGFCCRRVPAFFDDTTERGVLRPVERRNPITFEKSCPVVRLAP